MKQSGVYIIINKKSGRRYIGSSVNLRARFKAHLKSLGQGKHANRHLQRAWDHYGEDAFQFLMLEVCPPEDCRVREQWHLDNTEPDDLYNIAKNAYCPLIGVRTGKKNSPEQNAKIGEANRGRPNYRKGKTHDWGHKSSVTHIKRLTFRVQAAHLDGRVLIFDSVSLAAIGTGLKRKSVSNVLNGWGGQTRTQTGWSFTKIPKEG